MHQKKIGLVFFLFFLGIANLASAYTWSGTATNYYSNDTSVVFDPNGLGTTISGTLDISNMVSGNVIMFGLIDKTLKDNNGYMWQSGAYGYFYKMSGTTLRVGPSDGNMGGEIVSNFNDISIPTTNLIDFVLNIHNGTIDLSFLGGTYSNSTSYGTVKTLNNNYGYAWNEFANGAYLGSSNYLTGGSVNFNVNASPVVPIPAAAWLLGSGLVGLLALKRKNR